MQDPNTGYALTLAHTGATPSSGSDDQDASWLVDASVQYGSLGVQKLPQIQIGFIYPADEGDGTYIPGAGLWVRRSHPVTTGFSHSYELTLSLERYATDGVVNYDSAMTGVWRKFYAMFDPRPADVPLERLFQDQITLLAAESEDWATDAPTAQGFPFQVPVATGVPDTGIAYQMGYTGQQIPAAYQMLRYGLLHRNTAVFDKGKAQLNFWAVNAERPENASGLPDTVFSVGTTSKPSGWSNDRCHWPLFIRSLSDGMEGMANAAIFMRERNQPQTQWEILRKRSATGW